MCSVSANKYKIVSMDIPICKDDLCYCVAILDALTKDFFLRKGTMKTDFTELIKEIYKKIERFGKIWERINCFD